VSGEVLTAVSIFSEMSKNYKQEQLMALKKHTKIRLSAFEIGAIGISRRIEW
jgi:hypothetical protein